MKKIICIVLALTMLAVSYIPAIATTTSDFFISEVCYNSLNLSGDDLYEYIELVNISDKAVDLTGGSVTCQNNGGTVKSNALHTAATTLVQPGQVIVVVIYQKINGTNNTGYATAEEINALRADFNSKYGTDVSAESFYVAPKAVSGGASNIANTFNLSNSATEVVLSLLNADGNTLCSTTYNADKYNKNKFSVIFGISETEGPRCMGMAATTPGMAHKELYTEDTNNFTENLKIMTYNICASGVATDTVTTDESVAERITDAAHYFSNRYDDVLKVIEEQSPDVFCLNELNGEWWSYIGEPLTGENGKYAYSGVSSTTGKTAGNITDKWDCIPMILFDKAKYEMVDEGFFWCPVDERGLATPNNWVELKDIATGARFVVMSQHYNALYSEIKDSSAALVAEKIPEIAGDLPFILLGDYNSYDGSTPYKTLIGAGLQDSARMNADAVLRDTCVGFENTADPNVGYAIDLIMLSENDFTVNSYKVLEPLLENSHGVSDHNPVVIEVAMRKMVPDYDFFQPLVDSRHSVDGQYFFCGAEALTSKELLQEAFDAPLYYATSVTNEISCPGTGDTIYLKADPSQYLTIVMKGDVTGDGKIKTTDYSRIKNIMKGTYTPTEAQFLGADVNSDGKIGTTDYIRVKRHIQGLMDLFA